METEEQLRSELKQLRSQIREAEKSMRKGIVIEDVAHHRNGVGGEPFYVVTFSEDGEPMVGIVFAETYSDWKDRQESPQPFHCPRVAVFNRKLLGEGVISFGENSYRGDYHADGLCEAISEWEAPTTKDAYVERFVQVTLQELIENDLEGFLDLIAERAGDPLMMDIGYSVDGMDVDGELLIKVTGYSETEETI